MPAASATPGLWRRRRRLFISARNREGPCASRRLFLLFVSFCVGVRVSSPSSSSDGYERETPRDRRTRGGTDDDGGVDGVEGGGGKGPAALIYTKGMQEQDEDEAGEEDDGYPRAAATVAVDVFAAAAAVSPLPLRAVAVTDDVVAAVAAA